VEFVLAVADGDEVDGPDGHAVVEFVLAVADGDEVDGPDGHADGEEKHGQDVQGHCCEGHRCRALTSSVRLAGATH